MEPQQRVVDAYFDGINEDRFADVAALFAPDAQLIAPGASVASIEHFFARSLAPYRAHHDQPVRFIHAPGHATVEITFTGEWSNGAPVTFNSVDVFDFDDQQRITRLLIAYDSHFARAQVLAARGGDHRPVLISQIDHVEGEEEAFNAWFARHAEEVCAVPGVLDIQRYRALDEQAPGAAPPLRRWLAVYHLRGEVPPILAACAGVPTASGRRACRSSTRRSAWPPTSRCAPTASRSVSPR